MLHVNFKTYNSYVTDSLYQWDINQSLNITGLDLSAAPDVHFANANMERAIVRQATINNGTITVTIPNSLLQEPLPIKAYVGIYEGETFKVIESIKIPVIAKERPTDYSFVDDGGDIYSYNEILNKMISLENKWESLESKYGDITLDAIDNYIKWVNDVAELKTRVTPIELGGTGATTAEKAFENLGGTKYQKPWNVDDNVGQINMVNGDATFYIPSESSQTNIPFSFKTINSGDIYLSFYATGRNNYCKVDSVTILQNGKEVITPELTSEGYSNLIPLNVLKNDIIEIQITATNQAQEKLQGSVDRIALFANIETPYKYYDLKSGTSITAEITTNVLDALLGVNE